MHRRLARPPIRRRPRPPVRWPTTGFREPPQVEQTLDHTVWVPKLGPTLPNVAVISWIFLAMAVATIDPRFGAVVAVIAWWAWSGLRALSVPRARVEAGVHRLQIEQRTWLGRSVQLELPWEEVAKVSGRRRLEVVDTRGQVHHALSSASPSEIRWLARALTQRAQAVPELTTDERETASEARAAMAAMARGARAQDLGR